MSTTSPDLLIELDRSRPRGLRSQIEEGVRDAIRSGRLVPGTPLPSTRSLAADLGVTRGVVVGAYDQLVAEGYLLAVQGSGTVVSALPEPVPRARDEGAEEAKIVVDFSPGLPDLDHFPRAAWLRATRAALHTLPRRDLGYTDPRGLLQLRQQVVEYLGRVRGVDALPDRVMICNGFNHGFSMMSDVLYAVGHEEFAVEDPGYDAPRSQLDRLGATTRGVGVDRDGIVVDDLRRSNARVAIVTPAHQVPTGAVLSAARRSALAAWARDVEGYVIEDDYDAEYRYDRHPVGALQGVAPQQVIYCGTTSKSLAPGVRLGWVVLPEELVEPMVERRRTSGDFTSTLLQATYAHFLATGDLDRHLRRTRRIYRQRRDALIAALSEWLPFAHPSGISAGLHVLVTLPSGVDERRVVERAAAVGVPVTPLSRYRMAKRRNATNGLVLGYGSLTPADADTGVRLLAEAVAHVD
jgi:GntR family transcriptional regulator/MocR family aminotransferase